MSRISRNNLAKAVATVRAMNIKQKEQFADELFRTQPHLLASCLVQNQLGVSVTKMEFLINLLLICFQAMKESGLTWPLITEDEQERQLQRYIAIVKFGDDLGKSLQDQSTRKYIDGHPEKDLLAYVQGEIANWLNCIVPEESDKYVMMAAANFANCIAFVPMSAPESALLQWQKE